MASASETVEFFVLCCHSFIHLANIQRMFSQCQVLGTKRRTQPLNRSHTIRRCHLNNHAAVCPSLCQLLHSVHSPVVMQLRARHSPYTYCPEMSHVLWSAPFCSLATLPSALCRAHAYILGDFRDSVLQMTAASNSGIIVLFWEAVS